MKTKRTEDLKEFWSPQTLDDAKFMVAGVQAKAETTWSDEPQEAHLNKFLEEHMPVEGDCVIDFGCGIGRITRQTARLGCPTIGVDVSPEMLEYARQYCAGFEGADFVLSDGHGCTGVGDKWADIVITQFVFQHMPSIQVVFDNLKDFYRVLKTGGKAVIQTNSRGTDNEERPACYEGVTLSCEGFVKIAEEVGFSIVEVNNPYCNPKDEWYRIVLQK